MTAKQLSILSAQARDLLERILATFPHDDLFSSGVPAAPAHLRATLYHSDDSRLDSQIGRQLKELELNSIGILRRVSRKIRYLTLSLDFCQAPGPMRSAVNSDSGNSAAQLLPVIHKARDALDSKASEIIAVAAAATSSLDLIEKLKPHFPLHDVAHEFERYYAHRKKLDKPAIGSAFAKWMLRAEVPLRKPASSIAMAPKQEPERHNPTSPDADQPDLFEERAHAEFLRRLNARKLRKVTTR